ncbi:hypothetical protein NQ317_010950 [Molorchus minor]|uniref:Integrase zinc-binding domain-containing protein n=1 Tax=Molorchus minor TaxID=1323400 RepID=A0ABQ9JW24_9CUCU|nr:hypothetical protein NQ317_010950 [Molorchus minor]
MVLAVVYGKVCGRDCQMVIDTGSYHTIVKPNILAHCRMKPTSNSFILETAGGETLLVIGVHEAGVSRTSRDVLMGLELMKKHGFQLNLQERSIKTGHDEIIISMPSSDGKVRRITLTEDVILPAWSETIVMRKNNTVPVRLVNLKNCDQKLKNGDVLGKSQAVTCITKCEDIGEGPSYEDSESLRHLQDKARTALMTAFEETLGNTDGKNTTNRTSEGESKGLQEVHGGVGGGHFGVNKTLNKVRRFYWLRSRPMSKIGVDGVLVGRRDQDRSRGADEAYTAGDCHDVAGVSSRSQGIATCGAGLLSKWPERVTGPIRTTS